MRPTDTTKKVKPYKRRAANIVGVVFVVLFAAVTIHLLFNSHAAAPNAPTGPPIGTQLCKGGSDSGLLNSPYNSAPSPLGSTTITVTVPAGDDTTTPMSNGKYLGLSYEIDQNTTYYFEPGVHYLGPSQYGQIDAAKNDVFVGAPGAIIDGTDNTVSPVNIYAFDAVNSSYTPSLSTGVTIEYLTIRNFNTGNDEIMVNADAGPDWTIEYNTIENSSGGAGVDVASGDVVEHNCLYDNGQYGFQSVSANSNNNAPPTNITLSDNEISYNDTNGDIDEQGIVIGTIVVGASAPRTATVTTKNPIYFNSGDKITLSGLSDSSLDGTQTITSVGTAKTDGGITSFTFSTSSAAATNGAGGTATSINGTAEGASGGGKFWDTDGAQVQNNWIHNNGGPGLWADTDNTGFDITGNYIADNYGEGIAYEVSYNASIQDNTLLDNAWGSGPNILGFPEAAIYINNSGGDSNVSPPASGFGYQGNGLLVQNNVVTDNWGGVVVYENADRGCSLSSDNYCTLDNINTYTMSSCAEYLPGSAFSGTNSAYTENCEWKAQDVNVSNNDFNFTASNIGSDCTSATYCGFNGLFASGGEGASATNAPPNRSLNQIGSLASVGFTNLTKTSSSFSVRSTPSTLRVSTTESCGGQTIMKSGETCFAPGSGGKYPSYISTPGSGGGTYVFKYTGVTSTSFTGVTYDSAVSNGTGGTVNSGAIVSQYYPPGAAYPYSGYNVANQISNNQSNSFSNNTYCGTWSFDPFYQGITESSSAWQAAETNVNGSGYGFPAQDSGSTFTSGPCASGPNIPPSVSINSPADSSSVHGKTLSITSTATANDNGSIINAKLYVNNTLTQTLTSSPYNFTLDTTGYSDGNYTLKVQATDDQSNTTSQSVSVNITNGDFNGDGIVGLSDLIILAQNYGKTGTFSYSQGNITGTTSSPEVGLPDLIILGQNFGYNDGL